MKRLLLASLLAIAACTAVRAAEPSVLEKEFVAPPPSARPWVYWFWLNSNITKEGMTADLEAMQRAGIGGVLIMEVDQGAPVGPGELRRPPVAGTLQAHAQRGRPAGPGGQHVQRRRLVRQRRTVDDARTVDAVPRLDRNQRGGRQALRRPSARAAAERELLSRHHRAGLPHARRQRADREHQRQDGPRPAGPAARPGQICGSAGRRGDQGRIRSSILPTSFKDGRLAWDAPAGKWTVLRIGHTSTGAVNAPAPASGRGLECDKLSKEAADAMFAGLMGKIVADSPAAAGKTLVTTHIDSWEVHSQNWTPRMREEFQKPPRLRPLPLPARLHRPHRRQRRDLGAVPVGPAADDLRPARGELRRPVPRAGQQERAEALDRGLRRRRVRRRDLRRPLRRADGRVLVVGLRRGAQLGHRDDLRRPRLRQADRRRRGLHRHRRREVARPSGQHQDAGRLGLLRGDQPLRLPPLRHAAVDPQACPAPACRWAPGACTTSGPRRGGSSRPRGTNTWPAASTSCGRGCSWLISAICSPKGRRGASGRRSPAKAIRQTARPTTSTAARPRWC